jgi:hypothetical protein
LIVNYVQRQKICVQVPLEKYGELDRDKNFGFFINYIVIKLFLKSTKEVLSVEEVWHSPNMLSTMIYVNDWEK